MILRALHIHVMASLAVYAVESIKSESPLYKVQDSYEESVTSGGGGGNSGFHFPDFFENLNVDSRQYGIEPQFESRSGKSITNLYDDWKPPEDEGRQASKWSHDNNDDDDEKIVHKYSGDRPYSRASLKQQYNDVRSVGPSQGDYHQSNPEGHVHSHNYDVSHVYNPNKKTDYYEEDNLKNTSPQQFNNVPPQYDEVRHVQSEFKASPPDPFLDQKETDYDYFSPESSETVIKTVKTDQLDDSCVAKNKTSTIDVDGEQLTMNCFDCLDKKNDRRYERCVEKTNHKIRRKRELNNSTTIVRDKRQDDYYDGSGEPNYGPDSKEYRFGPEHFADDYSESYDDISDDYVPERNGEKCRKSKKGEMTCISCENTSTGGTYQQCSYASDPKKNSYERSVSKSYGTPRQKEEIRRKKIEYGVPKGVKSSKNYDKGPPKYNVRGRSSYSSKKPRGPSGTSRSAPSSSSSYVREIPDPYSPDPVSLIDDVSPPGTRSRKNVDSSFDPGYDETFSGLFPELVSDEDPIALAPPSYDDEYSDYDEGPERRYSPGDKRKHKHKHKHELPPPVGKRSLRPEYRTKNKTSCKKVRKNKMTCYQCVDEKGSKTEECTYSIGTEPKTTGNFDTELSKDGHSRGKRKFKKFDSQEREGRMNEDDGRTKTIHPQSRSNGDRQNLSIAAGDNRQSRERGKREKENSAQRRNYNPIPTDPPFAATELRIDDEGEEYSADTESVYDPTLGISLPKYMLERTEQERDFDEVLASG